MKNINERNNFVFVVSAGNRIVRGTGEASS